MASAELRQIVLYHLDQGLLNNALFLAGRLHALDSRNLQSIHLLALCHLRNTQARLAYHYTQQAARRGLHLGCAYVFAQACLDLNKRAEGIDALERVRHMWDGKNDWVKPADPSQRFMPDAASVLCLLGKLYQVDWRTDRAVECWVSALKLNPFMWDAFEALCDAGINVRSSSIFKLNPELAAILSTTDPTSAPLTSAPLTSALSGLNAGEAGQHGNGLAADDPFSIAEADPFTTHSSFSNAHSKPFSHGFQINDLRPPVAEISSTGSGNGIETPTSLAEGGNLNRKAIDTSRAGPSLDPPNAPLRKSRPGHNQAIEISADPSTSRPPSLRDRGISHSDANAADSVSDQGPVLHKRTISGSIPHYSQISTASDHNIRRSRRLFNQIRPNVSKPPQPPPSSMSEKEATELKKVKATGTKGRSAATTSTVGRVVSGNRKPMPPEQREGRENRPDTSTHPDNNRQVSKQLPKPVELNKRVEAVKWPLDLLCKLAQGYCSLSQYDSKAALRSFADVPASQKETPWVLARIARAHFEQNELAEAAKNFAKIRKLAPGIVADMEIYSTILWFEKHETELAFLSHELLDVDRSSPQAWCAIGNAFSLQRDHEQALKCFKRSTQLQPQFAYGHTLQGHEHMANEKFEDALAAYRRAISVDQRHYNGWYGLGKVYEKLGQTSMAEKHYRAAANINPTNAILYSCIGTVLEKQKLPEDALLEYDRACQLHPAGTQAQFRKARLLLSLQRHQEALACLNVLRDIVPNDSNVHYMLGRVYARLRDKSMAVKHYTTAMNLDPKAAHVLKDHMERLDEDEDYDSEEDDEMS